MRYFLRIEGVNLANVIDDTDQLSVRRGGGLMLLNVAPALRGLLSEEIGGQLKEIATGASIGLFEFEAEGDQAAELVRSEVEDKLRNASLKFRKLRSNHRFSEQEYDLPLRHATFVVDFAPVTDVANEQQAEQLVTAKNRWRQLQQPTLSLDGLWPESSTDFCTLDRTRPSTCTMDINEDNKNAWVCESARDRWDYGRGARQQFYARELQDVAKTDPKVAHLISDPRFTDDLGKLSERPPDPTGDEQDVVTLPDNVIDKLAIFYVDGNKFGKLGRDIFKKSGADGFREWSQALRAHHRELLGGLLKLADESPHLWKNDEEIRLETLLWGGDEILWVVPAWLGWDVARWFFGQEHTVKVQGEEQKLTYACGLVFCHTKAPIKNTSSLAHRLGDLAKQARPGQHGLAYEVLESYDDISGDLMQHRQRFLPPNHDVNALVLDPTRLGQQWETLTKFAHSPEVPVRQLYLLHNAWKQEPDCSCSIHEERLLKACKEQGIDLSDWLNGTSLADKAAAASETLCDSPIGWLHLHQMRPYLPKPNPAQ